MRYTSCMPRKKLLIVCVLVVLLATIGSLLLLKHEKSPITFPLSNSKAKQKKAADTPKPVPFDAKKYSLTDPSSPWIVVNKLRALEPRTYAPADLVVPNIPLRGNITSNEKYVRKDTATALESMVTAANNDGVHLNLQSGYRSYDFQVTLYNRYVQQQGQAAADTQSARPGYSEHQTGLAADLGGTSNPSCNVEACYATTTEGKWLAAHAYTYGFIVRYPSDKTAVTGYTYEPWHIRYVGVELATEMHTKNIETLEEFFGLPAAPDYQ
jgi:zinc D-Ala-D-Ala carboxypeptidase